MFSPQGSPSRVNGIVKGTHVYTRSGIFTVLITVTDNRGDAGSDSFTVFVDTSTLDTQPPAGVLNTPAPGSTVNADLGYVDVQWTDAGPAGLDPTTFDPNDVTISGVTVDEVSLLSGNVVRYWYNKDGESLTPGVIQVHSSAGAVADKTGNGSAEWQAAFTLNTPEPVDVSSFVTVRYFGLQYNRRTGVWAFYGTVTNNAAFPCRSPFDWSGPIWDQPERRP